MYCVEDADNTWVDDHFKTVIFDPLAKISESTVAVSSDIGEPYIALTAHDGASLLRIQANARPGLPFEAVINTTRSPIQQLHFIPYCLRDNRGGKGHMRVGLRLK